MIKGLKLLATVVCLLAGLYIQSRFPLNVISAFSYFGQFVLSIILYSASVLIWFYNMHTKYDGLCFGNYKWLLINKRFVVLLVVPTIVYLGGLLNYQYVIYRMKNSVYEVYPGIIIDKRVNLSAGGGYIWKSLPYGKKAFCASASYEFSIDEKSIKGVSSCHKELKFENGDKVNVHVLKDSPAYFYLEGEN